MNRKLKGGHFCWQLVVRIIKKSINKKDYQSKKTTSRAAKIILDLSKVITFYKLHSLLNTTFSLLLVLLFESCLISNLMEVFHSILPILFLLFSNNLRIKVSLLIHSLNNNNLVNLQTYNNLQAIMLRHNNKDKILQILLQEITSNKILNHHFGVLDQIIRNQMKIAKAIQRKKGSQKKIQANIGNKKGMRFSKKGL